jgi:hypothetical protein
VEVGGPRVQRGNKVSIFSFCGLRLNSLYFPCIAIRFFITNITNSVPLIRWHSAFYWEI